MSELNRVAITTGEPAGIGPDLCIQLAQIKHDCQLIYIGSIELLQQRARALNLPVKLTTWHEDLNRVQDIGEMFVLPVALQADVTAGVLNSDNAQYVLDTLQQGLEGCLSKRFAAVVTAPVHKAVINDAGMTFSGHTEFFADGAGVDKVVMMLATQGLRVALATTHLPLMAVSKHITFESLQRVIQITYQSLQQQFGVSQPRIAICGLNPHAGEGGHMGMEEIEVISPVIDSLKAQGMNLTGPWPADTIFNQDRLNDYDAVLAMYHDQGLPVLKHYAFGQAVNVTLGLPFIRTSVDHGTALDLAATGKASVSSLQEALAMAESMINSQTR